MSAEETLTPPALNRALLARQLLLSRSAASPVSVIEHLVGLQAQAAMPPYFGLWNRIADFGPDDLASLIVSREVVRIALMRGTIHLVSARDCLRLRPLLQPMLDRALKGSFGKALTGVDLDALGAAGRALVEERPRTFAELAAALAPQWPAHDPAALSQGVRSVVPLVQVPPRGLWGQSGQATHTSAESWLGGPLAGSSLDAMVLRYLAAFGPATVKDIQAWCGLTRLNVVVARLRPELRVFRDVAGKELYDLPDAPRPPSETPAPVRFMAEFDNILLSHADRTRIMSDEHRPRVLSSKNGLIPSTILVDGFARGLWSIERTRGTATLVVSPFSPLTPSDIDELTEEGARLLTFAAPEAAHDLRLLAAGARSARAVLGP